MVPSELPQRLRAEPDVVVEVDALPGGFVCSASYKHALEKPVVRPTLLGGKPIRKLFSKGQRAFLAEHAPDGPALEDLAVLGPLLVFKLRARPEGLNRKLVAELWLFPDGSRILELSTKGTPDVALQIAGEGRAFLSEKGIELEGEQATKTRKALEFFAGTLPEHDGSTTDSGGRDDGAVVHRDRGEAAPLGVEGRGTIPLGPGREVGRLEQVLEHVGPHRLQPALPDHRLEVLAEFAQQQRVGVELALAMAREHDWLL